MLAIFYLLVILCRCAYWRIILFAYVSFRWSKYCKYIKKFGWSSLIKYLGVWDTCDRFRGGMTSPNGRDETVNLCMVCYALQSTTTRQTSLEVAPTTLAQRTRRRKAQKTCRCCLFQASNSDLLLADCAFLHGLRCSLLPNSTSTFSRKNMLFLPWPYIRSRIKPR